MTVTVFTNPSNPQCEATEQELTRLGVRYVAVDLTQNPSTFEQIKDAGFKQIPVVISPERIMERPPAEQDPSARAESRSLKAISTHRAQRSPRLKRAGPANKAGKTGRPAPR